MSYYRETFPNSTVLPKMHILESHTIPWLKRWRMGAGIMGEQGAESLHAHFMRLDRTYQGVVNEVQRLKCVVKEHMLESAPSLVSLRPPPAKRMKRDRDGGGGESRMIVVSSRAVGKLKTSRVVSC